MTSYDRMEHDMISSTQVPRSVSDLHLLLNAREAGKLWAHPEKQHRSRLASRPDLCYASHEAHVFQPQ